MVAPGRLGRLRWLCRRGMKELDVLLEAFLARHQATLEQGKFPEFEDLLVTEDDLLWDWIQQSRTPIPERFASVITELRRGT